MGKHKQSAGAVAAARAPLTRRQKKNVRKHTLPAAGSRPPYGTTTSASTSTPPVEPAPIKPAPTAPEAAGSPSESSPRRRTTRSATTRSARPANADVAADTTRKATTLKKAPAPDRPEKPPEARLARPITVTDDTRRYPTLARMASITSRYGGAEAGAAAPEPVEPDLPPLTNEAEPDDTETVPVPAISSPVRKPVPTRRLADASGQAAATGAEQSQRPQQPEQPEQPAAPSRVSKVARRIRPLPTIKPLPIIAVIHSAVSSVAAISGVTMVLLGNSDSLWPLSFAAIMGLSGWIAYLLAQQKRTAALAGYLLIAGHVGLAVWFVALVGPRVSLMVVMIPLIVLAMRMAGWYAAVLETVATIVIYVAGNILWLNDLLAPRIVLQPLDAAIFDGVFLCLALLGGVAVMRRLTLDRAGAEYAARARLHEARQLRTQLTQLRQQVDEDTDLLDTALSDALRGTLRERVTAHNMLSPLSETVNTTMERLATLQRDREERIHLEGAIRVVTRAVERAWLGLPWTWPEWSGTPLDELVALLRAPRPSDTQTIWAEDTPTLAQIPTPDSSVITPIMRDHGMPSSAPSNPSGDLAWLDAEHQRATEDERARLFPHVRTTPQRLPWDEWNTWNEWDDAREQ